MFHQGVLCRVVAIGLLITITVQDTMMVDIRPYALALLRSAWTVEKQQQTEKQVEMTFIWVMGVKTLAPHQV